MSNMYGQNPETPQPQDPSYYNATPGAQAGAIARPPHTFVQALKAFIANYANFYGRANRSEFWYPMLLVMVINTLFTSIQNATGDDSGILSIVSAIFSLAVLIPVISVTVRRLHDAGFSGWFALLHLIAILGNIAVLIMCAMPSKPEGARFDNPSGEQPKLGTV